ncbi:MAG: hypothetical protein IKT88_01025 [Lachnospiraceae bacterium]|nr:hypothetical protein [Lachnospiraceae bacterium]
MKKLLVFMLCAVLAVPVVGMDVHATEPEKTADDVAVENASVLNDYLKNLKLNETELKKADEVMTKAAEELGLSYDGEKHKLWNDTSKPDDKTSYETADGVVEYVKTLKAQLDDCKTKVVAETPKEEKIEVNSNVIIGGKEYDTTIANAGAHCEIAVPLVNLGETDVENVVITPVLSGDVTVWPFDIEKTDYAQTCDKLRGEDSGKSVLDRKHTFRWTLKTRDDAVTGYTKLTFNVSYNEEDGSKGSVALDYYVQVNGVEPTENSGKISTPRVIVTGFTTTPEEVYAGDTFKLTLNLKNTSKTTAVSNMLFDIQGTQEGTDANNTYAAFLPTAGSSTIFVDSIAPNASKSISIELKSKADLAQKPYVVTVNMEYEDGKANPFTETASVSVPIKQEAKVDISSVQVMPENIEVGNEANVMFSIYNVGKTKLYNVNVKFEADSINGGDTFIGNLDPGATGNVDAYLSGQAATMDDGTVKIIISYEDEEGKEATIEESMTIFVNEPFYPEMYDDSMMMEGVYEEEKSFPWWGYAIIGAAAVSGVTAAALVIRKKRLAKKVAQEEIELIDSLGDNE